MKDLECCFGFLFEKYEKISKLEVLIGAQIVGTSAVVDLWVRRTIYPSTYRCQNDHWRKRNQRHSDAEQRINPMLSKHRSDKIQ